MPRAPTFADRSDALRGEQDADAAALPVYRLSRRTLRVAERRESLGSSESVERAIFKCAANRTGAVGVCGSRCARIAESLGDTVYLDQVPMPTPFNLDMLPSPKNIAGIEVYAGSTTIPPQFNGFNHGCGVILVWTREGC